jgi:hypothetical protein
MFTATPETTAMPYPLEKVLTASTYLVGVLLFPLLLEEKYNQTCTYILPPIALLFWGALSVTNYRKYTPRHVEVRWDAGLWIASAALYALLHLITASRGACMLFTVFGAPAIAFTAAYITVGRSARLAKEEKYPHLRERNATLNAARIKWLKQLGLNAFYIALLVVAAIGFFLFLNEVMMITGGNNSREKYVFLYGVMTVVTMYSAVVVRGEIDD